MTYKRNASKDIGNEYGKGTAYMAGRFIDAVAPYIPLFDVATKLIKEIIDLHDAAQYNKNTCARLMERLINYTKETVIDKVEAVVQEVQIMRLQLEEKLENRNDHSGDKSDLDGSKYVEDYDEDFDDLIINDSSCSIKTIMPFDDGLKIHQQIRKNESFDYTFYSDDDSDEQNVFRNINDLLENLKKDIRKDIKISLG
ncbi:443_t:CDS:2, partial [Cetraspora pellucida]